MSQTVSFPVGGMTCAACAARIEKVLNRKDGVQAAVNFASERAQVELEGSGTTVGDVIAAVRKAGFSVDEQSVDFAITGMTCAACAARIEKVLNRMPSVQGSVNYAAERAHVTYVPG
ncbi:MAG: cation transporter, partial [Gluconobacter sp.]